MADDVLTRNSVDELAVRVVQSSGDTGMNKDDVYTRDSQGRLSVRTVGGSGGGGGADYSAEIKALENAVSVLATSVDLETEIGGKTTVALGDLTAMDIDGRPSYKEAGATVYSENGVVGIIDSVDSTSAVITTVQYSVGGERKSDNGIKGDYCATYGITDMPNGVIESVVGTNNLNIPAGIVLKAAGSDTLTTLASETVHQTTSTSDFTLFYVAGEMLECGDVVYSETEPLGNGVDNYQAWFNPQLGKWQFRSNDTGNVWREAVATPLCDCYFSGGALTRIDFIGYRVLNKQTFGGGAGLPDQTGNAGKFLQTDGDEASWSMSYVISSQDGLGNVYYRINIGTVNGYTGNVESSSCVAIGTDICGDNCIGILGKAYYTASVAIGYGSIAESFNGTAIGNNAKVYGGLTHKGAIAIGYGASVSYAKCAIQLGGNGSFTGYTNSDANTFKVGNENGNFEMMSADGTIPAARHATLPTENGTYVLKVTVVDGVITTEWVLES